ncbi:MAG: tRNA (cytidine(34)-2'-O)-methyltransferase [Thermaerobacter sp.]|nr:tRNA (cytidine(34)-2'-O)-methyltransferase [Thermaerobacter sp.]
MHVVLVEPEIPPNTGNIARTCAATGSILHLVEPLGFSVSDRDVKRAGVDYWHLVEVRIHPSWTEFPQALRQPERLHLFTSRGGLRYDRAAYSADDVLVFGRESSGLPDWLLNGYPDRWRQIPMHREVRSLNLANAVAIAVYEGLRQMSFAGFRPE